MNKAGNWFYESKQTHTSKTNSDVNKPLALEVRQERLSLFRAPSIYIEIHPIQKYKNNLFSGVSNGYTLVE